MWVICGEMCEVVYLKLKKWIIKPMKKNRIFIIFLMMTVALFSINATTIEEILSSAKENSPSYQNVLLTYQNGLLNIAQLEEEDKVQVSVDANANTNDVALSVDPTVTVKLPNDGNTTIKGSASLSTQYDSGTTKIGGSLGVSHTFDFSGYTSDKAEDLSYMSTKYTTERNNKTSELSFEISVLSVISSILRTERSIQQDEFSVEKQETVYNKLVALKTYSEQSSVYVNTVNTLNSLKTSLEASKEQYNQLLLQYKTLTGLEWNGVEELEAPVLSLTTYEDGNTEVLLKSLSVQSSEESYKKAVSSANPSSLSTGLSLGIDANKKFTIGGTATYTAKNWNVSVTPSFDISSSGDVTPSVSISGHWNNDTSSSDREINRALNDAKTATNNYVEALSSYQEEALSYALKILQWNNSLTQAETDMEYKKTLLDNMQALYDLGLETVENLKSAELNYSLSQIDYDLVIIEGLTLERNLEIFAL